ncbi:MAG: lipoate--protein ligase [Clostridia bacterium]|nr:lipoate--protein ligase [Clostridia bacterium]
MIKKLVFVESKVFFPYTNQAVETEILNHVGRDELVIYLWANNKTVFIGKNQNAFSQCDILALRADGGYLARRFTGGGAVYHDKGNLNFSFFAHRENYDKTLNFSIIVDALKSLGVTATLSGRNDMIADGKKFSGNAFYESKDACLHHGTLLIKSVHANVEKYLRVHPEKIATKGVKSVSSRIVNLTQINPAITPEKVVNAIFIAAKKKFPQAEIETRNFYDFDRKEVKNLIKHYGDQNYILGDDIHYDFNFVRRFEWGTADIRVKLSQGKIEKIKIYSDALDTELATLQEKLLLGADIKTYDGEYSDIARAIEQALEESDNNAWPSVLTDN